MQSTTLSTKIEVSQQPPCQRSRVLAEQTRWTSCDSSSSYWFCTESAVTWNHSGVFLFALWWAAVIWIYIKVLKWNIEGSAPPFCETTSDRASAQNQDTVFVYYFSSRYHLSNDIQSGKYWTSTGRGECEILHSPGEFFPLRVKCYFEDCGGRVVWTLFDLCQLSTSTLTSDLPVWGINNTDKCFIWFISALSICWTVCLFVYCKTDKITQQIPYELPQNCTLGYTVSFGILSGKNPLNLDLIHWSWFLKIRHA